MIIFFKKKKVNISCREVGFLGKVLGLMFKSRNTENLLFSFNYQNRIAIHSFFVFFPFLAIWLDDKNNVVEYRVIDPFCFHVKPKKDYFKLIEIPFSEENKKIFKVFVGRKV